MINNLIDDKLTDAPVAAATVILVRQAPDHDSLQTLLLCRGKSRTVMNNAWVFPGGKLDKTDLDQTELVQNQLKQPASQMLNEPDIGNDFACALFAAACRETFEETGVKLDAGALQTWSRWITPNEPAIMKKRFDARFFIGAMPQGQTAVHDGQEATDSQWCSAKVALQQYIANKLVLAPPQIMTLIALAQFNTVDMALEAASNTPPYRIKPNVIKSDTSRILTYPGDKDHPESIKEMPGPTRLVWNNNHFEPPDGYEQFFI